MDCFWSIVRAWIFAGESTREEGIKIVRVESGADVRWEEQFAEHAGNCGDYERQNYCDRSGREFTGGCRSAGRGRCDADAGIYRCAHTSNDVVQRGLRESRAGQLAKANSRNGIGRECKRA